MTTTNLQNSLNTENVADMIENLIDSFDKIRNYMLNYKKKKKYHRKR